MGRISVATRWLTLVSLWRFEYPSGRQVEQTWIFQGRRISGNRWSQTEVLLRDCVVTLEPGFDSTTLSFTTFRPSFPLTWAQWRKGLRYDVPTARLTESSPSFPIGGPVANIFTGITRVRKHIDTCATNYPSPFWSFLRLKDNGVGRRHDRSSAEHYKALGIRIGVDVARFLLVILRSRLRYVTCYWRYKPLQLA